MNAWRHLLLSIACLPALAVAATVDLPPDSLFRVVAPMTDARSQRFALGDRRGRPQVVSMFYTSCAYTCPMLIDGAKAVRAGLSAEERARLAMTLVTIDPARDTPAVLARTARERDLDPATWTLAAPSPRDVRTVAGLLGIRYRELANGDFNHTTALVLLDADGRIVARTERVGGKPDPAFVAAVRRALAALDPARHASTAR
jgi:protein SCO1